METEHVMHTFAPVYDKKSRVLILGTFPSVKSRENRFYYGHPRNRFWKVTAAVCGCEVPETIEEKKAFLLENHIAIWDVIASCDIAGSSDSSITNVVANDIERLLTEAPIEAVFLNGAKAYELFMKYCSCKDKAEICKLPSTSPANAAWSLERLIEEWKKIRREDEMYTDRQLKIIAVLKSADGWMSGSLLRENIGVSSRTLQMDIKAINEKQSGEPLIQSNNRLGYLLKNKIALEQEQKSYGQENYVHSKQIITLLLFEKEYTSIGTISERLFFSRSSVTSDLSQVKRIISRTPGANLLVSGQYGLKIQASENVKRIMCMKTMQSRQDYHMLFSEEEMEQFAENQKKLQAVLAEVFTRNQFIVSGEAYHDFARYLAVCMMRSQMGFPVTEEEDGTTEMPGRLSTELVDEIEKVCTYRFKEKEKQNVEARLKELNMVCKETDIQLDMLQKLEVFIQRVQEETGLKLQVERDLLEVLSDHVSRMELRIQNGRNNIGNHTKEMAKRYPLEMHLLRTCLSPVLNTEIPDAEMGYLVLYFASAIERNRRKPDILFISDQSASSIYNVQNKLKGFLEASWSPITSARPRPSASAATRSRAPTSSTSCASSARIPRPLPSS